MACKVWLYALVRLPLASAVVVTVSGGSLTTMLKFAELVEAVGVCESVTVTVKLMDPVTVPLGVPEITPALLKVKPVGKFPAVTLQL